MNHNGEQFSGLVGVHPAGSKPRTKGAGTEPYGAPYRERLADKINSVDGKTAKTRPEPGGGWGIPDKYKD